MPKLTIILKADGTIITDAEGFQGKACMKQTEDLLAGLAKQVIDTKQKHEYYVNQNEASVGN